MKKVVLSAALALAVAGSWAFYPKQASQDAYMQLSASLVNGKGSLIETSPDGQVTEVAVKEANLVTARSKVIIELNRLRQNGWRVVQLTSRAPVPAVLEETYLLEK
ncbi:hypothetical protein [Hymenobacter daeguensis]